MSDVTANPEAQDRDSSLEPPLVQRVLPTAPLPPGPGFPAAVLWCLAFLLVQLSSAISVILLFLGSVAFRADDPGKFLNDQLEGFAKAAAKTGPNDPPRPPIPTEIGKALAYGMLAAQFGSLAMIALVLPRAVGTDWKRQLAVRTPAGFHLFLTVLILPAFMILSEGLQELILRLTGITRPAANEALNGTFTHIPLAATLAAVSLGPGLVEEFWCRGFLGRGLVARYGVGWGVFATSILFGLLHMDPSLILVTGLMGAYLHFLYLASRSIWVPVLLHMLNNGFAVIVILTPELQAAGKAFQDDRQGFRAVTEIAALGLLVFASVAMWTSRPELIRQSRVANSQDDWQPEYPGISLPPPGIPAKLGYGVVSPVAMILTLAAFGFVVYRLSQL